MAYRFVKFALAFAWIGLCLYCLFKFINHENAWHDNELIELLYLEMMVLTFPIGYISALIWDYLISYFGIFPVFENNKYWSTYANFIIMMVAGYLQWFVLIPIMLRKMLKFFRKAQ